MRSMGPLRSLDNDMKTARLLLLLAVCSTAALTQAETVVPHTFQDGTPAEASEVNENFDAPDAPTIDSIAAGDGQVVITFNDASASTDPALPVFNDPGTGPWELVATDALIEECGLDPDILASVDETAPFSYVIVRYGKLCHEFYRPDHAGKK